VTAHPQLGALPEVELVDLRRTNRWTPQKRSLLASEHKVNTPTKSMLRGAPAVQPSGRFFIFVAFLAKRQATPRMRDRITANPMANNGETLLGVMTIFADLAITPASLSLVHKSMSGDQRRGASGGATSRELT